MLELMNYITFLIKEQMSFFDDISGKLFPANKKVGIQEVLTRDQKFINQYKEWTNLDAFNQLKKDLLKSWELKLKELDPPLDMITYTSDYANGFTLYPDSRGDSYSLDCLMEYLKEKLMGTSYRLVHLVRRMDEKNEVIETIEKYYLKPPLSNEVPINQMYGNVEIEVLKHGKEEKRLKFLVSVYSDRNYTKPWEINDLMYFLFED